MRFLIQRYQPQRDNAPYLQALDLDADEIEPGMMLLAALKRLKRQDASLTFRHSCGEGVCGSDGMNINGRNGLACITPLAGLKEPITVRPLPGMPIIRDLVVDMGNFQRQYRAVQPWLIHDDPLPERELLQTPAERAHLDGLYECILCGCCTAACPSYWWNPSRFLGPAALLQAARFVFDSRDQAATQRLAQLDDAYALFRCHAIMNCVEVCPKALNPTRAIGRLKQAMLRGAL